ncbi:MAG: DNA mismatch repair protein MutS [Candidatus Zixiibacteriota bacterium]
MAGKKSVKKKHTPLMEQYNRIKSEYPDALLFFRMGDFYEMFGKDAEIAAEILGITLTSRNHGKDDKIPLAGVPYHAAESYLSKLLSSGLKVAVCEQIENPKYAKGIVKRAVTEMHTPGTITERLDGDDVANRYLVGILPFERNRKIAIVCSDVSTGEFWTHEVDTEELVDELSRIEPKEIVIPEDIDQRFIDIVEKLPNKPLLTYYPTWHFELNKARETMNEQFGTQSLDGFGNLTENEIRASGGLLIYLRELKKRELSHISSISIMDGSDYLVLDNNTIRNLELLKTMSGEKKEGTLLSSLDDTKTAMGKRLIRQWLLRPLVDESKIDRRLNAVEELMSFESHLEKLRKTLSGIGDLERHGSRLGMKKSTPRDLLAIYDALEKIPELHTQIGKVNSDLLNELLEDLDPMSDFAKLIAETISPDAPLHISNGGIIRNGIHADVDELRSIIKDGDSWIRSKEEEIKQKTGITKLKIKHNKVFGYFIEVPRGQSEKVPESFIRKQTLVSAERFITPELKEIEVKVINAQERILELEKDYYLKFRESIAPKSPELLSLANAIGKLDVLAAFAQISRKRRFIRPKFNDKNYIEIKEGRHPVVEDVVGEAAFVPNNTYLDGDSQQIIVLTGPNMSGKSTFLRQVAIISLMAQCGCLVPAESADISIVDKIFCRVGASDNIVLGRSTFLTEMIEAANILNNATPRSLVLLDEIGRGTSTFDGLSIAWAITEYLHENPNHEAKTIFATHYHELTVLESMYSRIRNFQIMVRKRDENIKFLYRISEGGCDDSYGIYVAKLAGLPEEVIGRSKNILRNLEKGDLPDKTLKNIGGISPEKKRVDSVEVSLFEPEYHPMVIELQQLDIESLTPIKALNLLNEWSKTWGGNR